MNTLAVRENTNTALRLGIFFGNSAKFWLGLQDDFDIEEELTKNSAELEQIKQYGPA